jgi:hypothetical protein
MRTSLIKKSGNPQKFPIGTFVKIADDLGPYMTHFEKGFYACIDYTYAQKYGGGDTISYCLNVRVADGKWRRIAWYYEYQLTLVEDQELVRKFINEIGDED